MLFLVVSSDVLTVSGDGATLLSHQMGDLKIPKGTAAASRAGTAMFAGEAGPALVATAADLNAQKILENVSDGAQGGRGEGDNFLDLRFCALLLEDYGLSTVVALEEGDKADEGRGERRRLTIHAVSDQNGLNNKVDVFGDSKMNNGDETVISEGVYSCGDFHKCHDGNSMFNIFDLNGKIRCEKDNLGCVVDGESRRKIMGVLGTAGGGTLILRSIHFYRGHYGWGGGGLGIYGAEVTVTLEITLFSECRATSNNGGGAIQAELGTLNLFAVSFSGNSAANNNGGDIYVGSASVTIHNTCPTGEGGFPSEGELLIMPTSQAPNQALITFFFGIAKHPPRIRLRHA